MLADEAREGRAEEKHVRGFPRTESEAFCAGKGFAKLRPRHLETRLWEPRGEAPGLYSAG